MNTLPASEIKRRGVAALEEYIKKGPIHIIKNNQPTYVVLSEKDYAALVQNYHMSESTATLWDLLDNRPWVGKRNSTDIKKQIKKERSSWKK